MASPEPEQSEWFRAVYSFEYSEICRPFGSHYGDLPKGHGDPPMRRETDPDASKPP